MTVTRLSLTAVGLAAAAAALAPGSAPGTFPGRNGPVVFERGGGLVTQSAAGGRATAIPGSAGAESPVWSRSRTRIAFEESGDAATGGESIGVMNADGTGRRTVAEGADPAWGPDGRIVFENGGALYVVNADGTGQRRLVADGDEPAWSARGRIAFVRRTAGGGRDIHTITPAGTGLRRITSAAGDDVEPDWSPDGRRIVFIRNAGGNDNVHTMTAAGARVRRITRLSGVRADDPAWSPDGRRIVFERKAAAGDEIVVMTSSGARQRRLGAGGNPDWRRR